MAAAAQASAARQLSQVFHRSAGFQVAVLVGEAHNLVRVANIDPLGVGSGRVERNAEGLVQVGGEHRGLLRLAVRSHTAKYLDLPRLALRQKNIAVGRGPQQPGIIEAGRVKLHLEAFGSDGPGIRGARRHRRPVVDRLLRRRGGQVGRRHVTPCAGRLVSCVSKRGLAGQDLGWLGIFGGKRTGQQQQGGSKQDGRTRDAAHETSRGK